MNLSTKFGGNPMNNHRVMTDYSRFLNASSYISKIRKNSALDLLLLSAVKKKTSKRSSKAGHRLALEYTNTKRSNIYTKTANL